MTFKRCVTLETDLKLAASGPVTTAVVDCKLSKRPLSEQLILAIHRMMEQHQMQAHKERERRTSGSGET